MKKLEFIIVDEVGRSYNFNRHNVNLIEIVERFDSSGIPVNIYEKNLINYNRIRPK